MASLFEFETLIWLYILTPRQGSKTNAHDQDKDSPQMRMCRSQIYSCAKVIVDEIFVDTFPCSEKLMHALGLGTRKKEKRTRYLFLFFGESGSDILRTTE